LEIESVGSFNAKKGNEAAAIINKWCAQSTNDMIKELVTPDLMQSAQLVIANAIYFKGLFVKPFDKKKSEENVPFYASNKREKEVSKVVMMYSHTEHYAAHKVNGIYDVVKLKYETNGKLSLILVLDISNGDEVAPLLSTKDIIALDEEDEWRQRKIKLFLPKFKFEYEVELSDVLKTMGIKKAFDARANFSNMAKKSDLNIDAVIHKAVIEVDEEGTEAAAATAVVMTRGMPKPSPQCRFDHPFQFFIFDEVKQVALFAGMFNGK